uniref:WD repeat-containing protein 55 homolog n=1 Tax=Glossina austeni TaxID=7395 RepID=A0A1A9V411_GLOAU
MENSINVTTLSILGIICELEPLINNGKPSTITEMKFLLLEQKYLEHLDDGCPLDALHVLRNELTPLQYNISRVHQLSSYMMCSNNHDLYQHSKWEGKGILSRALVMERLQTFLQICSRKRRESAPAAFAECDYNQAAATGASPEDQPPRKKVRRSAAGNSTSPLTESNYISDNLSQSSFDTETASTSRAAAAAAAQQEKPLNHSNFEKQTKSELIKTESNSTKINSSNTDETNQKIVSALIEGDIKHDLKTQESNMQNSAINPSPSSGGPSASPAVSEPGLIPNSSGSAVNSNHSDSSGSAAIGVNNVSTNGHTSKHNGVTANDNNSNSVGTSACDDQNDHDVTKTISWLGKTNQEIIRLIGQYLQDLGLESSVKTLMSESGCYLEHPSATKFREHVLSGEWAKADADLQRSKWEGKGILSRALVMERLQTFLPPSVMMPPRRLRMLLQQAVELQAERCPCHDMAWETNLQNVSLLTDHCCATDGFPMQTIQILTDHCDEVWFCKFSPDGLKLATGSKDATVIIWDVDPYKLQIKQRRVLDSRFQMSVAFISWSPDSKLVLIGGPEDSSEICIFNVDDGRLILKMSHNIQEDSFSCGAFNRDGTRFVCGGQKGQFYLCDLKATILDSWEGVRINSVIRQQDYISCRQSLPYNFDNPRSDFDVLRETHPIMTFSVNSADRLALLNISNQGLHLWDIEDKCLVRRFQGIRQSNFAIHSCFGGVNESFVASGSEDKNVVIWHIKREEPLAKLSGHTKTVNCFSWNPAYPSLLASASDDATVRIWGPTHSIMPMQFPRAMIAPPAHRHRLGI